MGRASAAPHGLSNFNKYIFEFWTKYVVFEKEKLEIWAELPLHHIGCLTLINTFLQFEKVTFEIWAELPRALAQFAETIAAFCFSFEVEVVSF